jgi:hypothetical protein
MLFIPPVVPAVGLGRFKRKEIDTIRTHCTEVNHPYAGITRNCSSPPHLDGGLLWCYDNHRVLVRSNICVRGHTGQDKIIRICVIIRANRVYAL